MVLPTARKVFEESGPGTAFDQSSIEHFLRKVRMHRVNLSARAHGHEGASEMPTVSNHAGQAALSICEALLLAMSERGVLPEHEIVGVLRDAAATHENAVGTELEMEEHRAVADLINAINAGGHSARPL
jgi:hypothetical protein